MTKKTNPKDRLRNPQLTVYLEKELQDWLKDRAKVDSDVKGYRISVSEVLREILNKVKNSA